MLRRGLSPHTNGWLLKQTETHGHWRTLYKCSKRSSHWGRVCRRRDSDDARLSHSSIWRTVISYETIVRKVSAINFMDNFFWVFLPNICIYIFTNVGSAVRSVNAKWNLARGGQTSNCMDGEEWLMRIYFWLTFIQRNVLFLYISYLFLYNLAVFTEGGRTTEGKKFPHKEMFLSCFLCKDFSMCEGTTGWCKDFSLRGKEKVNVGIALISEENQVKIGHKPWLNS